MNHLTIIIYLFFIQRNGQLNQTFFDEIFHFHRFLTLEHEINWNRLFAFGDGNVYDAEYEQVLKTMNHHQLLTPTNELSERGVLVLKEKQAKHPELIELLSSFLAQYKNQTGQEDSCYMDIPNHMMACHLCPNRVCQDLHVNFKDFLHLIGFKGLKNPSRSWTIKNPYS